MGKTTYVYLNPQQDLFLPNTFGLMIFAIMAD